MIIQKVATRINQNNIISILCILLSDRYKSSNPKPQTVAQGCESECEGSPKVTYGNNRKTKKIFISNDSTFIFDLHLTAEETPGPNFAATLIFSQLSLNHSMAFIRPFSKSGSGSNPKILLAFSFEAKSLGFVSHFLL